MKHEMTGWQWYQMNHMEITASPLQTNNHTNISSLKFFTGQIPFLMPKQQCQSIGCNKVIHITMGCNATWLHIDHSIILTLSSAVYLNTTIQRKQMRHKRKKTLNNET